MNGLKLIPLFAGFLFSGCASMHYLPAIFHQRPALATTQNEISSDTAAGSERRMVTFPLVKAERLSPDPKQPETLVQLALDLAEKGEHVKAAALFLEAAQSKGAGSKDNDFRVATLAASASEFLQAGELQAFDDTVKRLRNEMDRFRTVSAEPEISVLLAISDKLAGRKPEISMQVPWAVRDLFREGTNK